MRYALLCRGRSNDSVITACPQPVRVAQIVSRPSVYGGAGTLHPITVTDPSITGVPMTDHMDMGMHVPEHMQQAR